MWSWLSLFRPRAAVASSKAVGVPHARPLQPSPEASRIEHSASAVVYPPRDPGLPIATAADLIADQAELLGMLKIHAAVPPKILAERFSGPIERVAAYVNTLPGTATSAFSGAGGLFRASLETAYAAFRASDGRIFTGNLGVEARHKLEGRWRYVCFLAGLLYPVGGALGSMVVCDERGRRWAPELDPLTDWAQGARSSRLYVTWTGGTVRLGPAPLAGTFALRLAGRQNIEWLNEGSPALASALVDIATGATAARDMIATDLVSRMWASVHERELARVPSNYGHLTIGADVSPYLMDALVGLSKGKWALNERVAFADANGYYLQWPEAGADIIEFCSRKEIPGIPSTEGALLNLLVSLKFIVAEGDGLALVQIADSAGEIAAAVKLTRPGLLLPDGMTLANVSTRPVLLKAVVAQDPLADSRGTSHVQSATGSQAAAEQVAAKQPARQAPTLDDQLVPDLHEDEVDEKPETASAPDPALHSSPVASGRVGTQRPPGSVSPSPGASSGPTATARAEGQATKKSASRGTLVEGKIVDLTAMLPPDVAESLSNFHAQILGRLVEMWRKKASGTRLMRMCEHGAAIELGILADLTQDPPTFLSELGSRGFLYTSPSTPGKMIHQVAVTEGGQAKVSAFILPHHAVRRLALE